MAAWSWEWSVNNFEALCSITCLWRSSVSLSGEVFFIINFSPNFLHQGHFLCHCICGNLLIKSDPHLFTLRTFSHHSLTDTLHVQVNPSSLSPLRHPDSGWLTLSGYMERKGWSSFNGKSLDIVSSFISVQRKEANFFYLYLFANSTETS